MNTVLLIDDHDIVRFGLEMLLQEAGLDVIASVNSLAAGLKAIHALRPDVVLTDLGTGDSQGLDTVRRVVGAQACRPVVVVSMQDELLYGEKVLACGAAGYVMKENAHANAVPAARAALAGGTWVSPQLGMRLASRVTRRAASGAGGRDLTSRELDVMELLKLGKSTKEIAAAFDLGVRTVDFHRANIKHKLELRTGAQLIAFASNRL
jgi:DNA-binding NarL/FixJ family response regulator